MNNSRLHDDACRRFDESLLRAIDAGATVVMNDADWTSIREAAKASVASREGTGDAPDDPKPPPPD
jgi:hypothetical protein